MMDDSDLDFSDLCSRLLKRRVRKKAGEGAEEKKPDGRDGDTRSKGSNIALSCPKQTKKSTNQSRKRTKKDASSEPLGEVKTDPRAVLQAVSVSQLTENGTETQSVTQLTTTQESKVGVKEKVLSRMQRFKRMDPQKLQHADSIPTTSAEAKCVSPPSTPAQNKELSLDERLALRLQQELDREFEAETQVQVQVQGQDQGRVVDVDQGGLFFCQLCYRDLSAMTPQLRTQHINRCLDQNESQAALAPPRPTVPECPICGKGFKSHKSRSTHLKRCSADMGVPTAVLLQALQRQAGEAESDSSAGQSTQTGGTKRRSPSGPSQPGRKKPKKKAEPMDEDTMVALALSRSLLDQEAEKERVNAVEVTEVKGEAPPTSVGPTLQWHQAAAGKGRRRRKGAPAAPPPLLLRQDPEEALRRLQERVSLMLLRSRTPSPPPTPTLPPSALLPPQRPSHGEAGEGDAPSLPRLPAPLWHKSALPEGCGHTAAEFYTPELGTFIQPYAGPQSERSLSTMTPPVKTQPAPLSQPPLAGPTSQAPPCSPPPAASTPTLTSLLPSQVVEDLLELGAKGLSLAADPAQGGSCGVAPDQPSGPSSPYCDHHVKPNCSLSLTRLASDLGSMVNNPQLSDVQLQVDSGEVFFAHSFMLYARCPLLAQQVHGSGFGVQEEGMPAAQRVLLGEVPAGAVLVLLQFLYSAHCPLTPSLAPHVQELASRFDLAELSEECRLYLRGLEQGGSEAWGDGPEQEPAEGQEEQDNTQVQQHFLELLRSMWSSEDEGAEEEEGQGDGRGDRERSIRVEEQQGIEGEENGGEEQVDEEELEEIYEFAATQRRGAESALRHERQSLGEEEEEEEEAEEDDMICFAMEEEKTDEREAVEASDRGLDGVGKSTQEETPTGTKNCLTNPHHTDVLSSHHTDDSSSRHTDDSNAAVETHGCAEAEKDSHSAEQHPEPGAHADANLEDSFDHLFSQSWGEYAEPSSTSATQHLSKSKPKTVQVIDLSISPPPPTFEPSLPVPGVSPELTVSHGSQRHRMSPELPVSHGSQRHRMSPELTISGGSQRARVSPEQTVSCGSQRHRMSPQLTVSCGSQRHRMSPELTVSRGSQRATVSPELRVTQSNQGESQGRDSFGSQCSKEVELIVLSDSSNDSPTCLTPSPPQPRCFQSPLILPEDSPGYTCIKDVAEGKDSPSSSRAAHPMKDPSASHSVASDTSAMAQSLPLASRSTCVGDAPGDQSLLDGSAEVSWLVPSTPHITSRTRNSSTQTQSSIRRTRLFPGSSSSQSSSSPPPGRSKPPSSNSISPPSRESASEGSISNQKSTTSHLTKTKLQESKVTGDDSPVFLPPRSLSSYLSSATDFTPSDLLKGASVGKPTSKRFGQPVSSTPLHSVTDSPMSSHLLSDSPFLRQVERNQHVQDGGTVHGDVVPSDGSPERSGSLGLLHLREISPSSSPEEAHMSRSTSQQRDSRERSNPGSSERTGGVSEHCTSGTGQVDMKGVDAGGEVEINGMVEAEDKDELSPQQSFNNYDEPPMPFDEPPMAYDDPPMAFDEPPVAYDDPPMAFNDSWGLGDGGSAFQKPRFSLRLESSGDASTCPTLSPRTQALPLSPPAQGLPQPVTTIGTPPANSTEPQPSTSVLDPQLWDSWEEEGPGEAGDALPLSKRLGAAVAPPKRVAQLRTPVASKKSGPLVPITPMPDYSDMDTPDLKNRLNRFGVRPLPKRQMVQKLKEIHQYTHQLETSESEEEQEAPAHGCRPPPVSLPARSCAQSLNFKEPRAPPAVSPRKLQVSQAAQEPLSLSQSSNASSTDASQDSDRSNPELPLSDSDSSSDSEGSVTASQAAARHGDKLQAVRRFILSDPELHGQVLQYRPLVLSQLQERLKAAGIRLGAAKLLDFLDAQCITFTTAKPGQKAPPRRRRKKTTTAAAAAKGAAAAAGDGGVRGKGGRKRGGGAKNPD